MTRRAAASTSSHGVPTVAAATAGRLRLVQHGVELGELGRRLAGVDAAGDVGAVAGAVVGEHRAAEVAQHDLAGADDPVARLVVRAGRVRPGGDDGEVHPVVALGEQPAAEVGRHLGLGAPDQRRSRRPAAAAATRSAAAAGARAARRPRPRPSPPAAGR